MYSIYLILLYSNETLPFDYVTKRLSAPQMPHL